MRASAATGSAAFARRALIVIGLAALAMLLWRVAYALLLAFGGVLFGCSCAGSPPSWRARRTSA